MKFSRVAVLLAALACTAGARAQVPAEAGTPPRFAIHRLEVIGNTLLATSELEAPFEPFAGQDRDFADIQRAREALERAYRDLGYGAVQALLPEQDITQGVVRFRVLQPRVGRVVVEGNTHFDERNIRDSLPTVKEGESPNSKAIARNLHRRRAPCQADHHGAALGSDGGPG